MYMYAQFGLNTNEREMPFSILLNMHSTCNMLYLRSEHERHTGGCPYVRGEYTDNVPSSASEASHPAVYCSEKGDSVVCISSTSTGTGLVAVGTECGHISIWELDRGLLIMVCR